MIFIRKNVLCVNVFLLFLDFISISQCYIPGCPDLTLERGKVRVKQRGRLVRFQCLWGYELVGQRFAACTTRGWDTSVPKCIRPGCMKLQQIENGMNIEMRNGAATMFFCNPGYTLMGEGVTYCDGRKWNGTIPTCKSNETKAPALSCDFETDTCGWTPGTKQDYDWERTTPSGDSPPYTDHTDLKSEKGYFMSLSDSSLAASESALLISPLFPSNLSTSGCFSFYYFSIDPLSEGTLRVYVHPESVSLEVVITPKVKSYMMVEINGEQEEGWQLVQFDFNPLNEPFQIVIEASRETTSSGQMFIDDFMLSQSEQCPNKKVTTKVHRSLSVFSCYNRCNHDPFAGWSLCQCNETCGTDSKLKCCPDYNDYCLFGISEPRGEYTDTYSTQEYSTSTITNPIITNTPKPKVDFGRWVQQRVTGNVLNMNPHYMPDWLAPRITTNEPRKSDDWVQQKQTTRYYLFKSNPYMRNLSQITTNEERKTTYNNLIQTTSHDDGTVPTNYFKETSTPKTVEVQNKATIMYMSTRSITKTTISPPTTTAFKATTTAPQTTTATTKTMLKTTSVAAEKPTLQFKTPPQPLKNATGILNKTVIAVSNTTKINVTKISTTMSDIKVIPLTKPTTKISTSTTVAYKVLPTVKTTLSNVQNVSKTFDHYGRHPDGNIKNNGTVNFTANGNGSPKYVAVNNVDKLNVSKYSGHVEDVKHKPISTLSAIVIIFLCLAVTSAITVIVLTKTGYLSYWRLGDAVRSRMAPRRAESSADMRFLVEDEELEHDL